MSKLKIEFREWDLNAVMEHFIEGFEAKVEKGEWFIDTAKSRVIFKLFVEVPTPNAVKENKV